MNIVRLTPRHMSWTVRIIRNITAGVYRYDAAGFRNLVYACNVDRRSTETHHNSSFALSG